MPNVRFLVEQQMLRSESENKKGSDLNSKEPEALADLHHKLTLTEQGLFGNHGCQKENDKKPRTRRCDQTSSVPGSIKKALLKPGCFPKQAEPRHYASDETR
jgi:hypothetical protein